jgi:hypothetical protein
MGLRAPNNQARNPRFEFLRKQAGQRATAEAQKGQEAIKRKFAAQGALASGAAVKNIQQQQQQAARQKEQAIQAVDVAEAEDVARRQEVKEAREFQAGQAEKQRGFAAEQAEKQRGFQREISDKDLAFRQKVFSFDKSTKLAQLDLAKKEFAQSTLERSKDLAAQAIEFGDFDERDLTRLSEQFLAQLEGRQTETLLSRPQFEQRKQELERQFGATMRQNNERFQRGELSGQDAFRLNQQARLAFSGAINDLRQRQRF